MLRVSDGQWDTQKVLRSITTVGDSTNLVGRTITGTTTAATAIIESIKKFIIGNHKIRICYFTFKNKLCRLSS